MPPDLFAFICNRPHTQMIVERLGRFLKVVQPGWFFAIPMVDQVSNSRFCQNFTSWISCVV
jgi:regulator of protease activity HflC (stomatin/prohibitin superfamily)